MTNEELNTKKKSIRKLVDLEFERVSRAALQEYEDSSAVCTAKSKIVELMGEMGVFDGTILSSTASI
jgi:hypothetical protein